MKNGLIVVLLLALAGSIGLNRWLYQRTQAYYQRSLALQLDPIGLKAFPDKAVKT